MVILDLCFRYLSALIVAVSSILLLVVYSSEPDRTIFLLLSSKIIAPHPPFPGLPIQAPSV